MSKDKDLSAFFTVCFYGWPCETAQTDENVGKNAASNLLRHKPGRYYARAFAGGKEVWKSLKTSHFSVAEAKRADGGALAIRTYGHLRREHSIVQAQKVSFAPVDAKQADVIPFPALV